MRQITFTEAINEALRQEMERDPSVILIGEDIGVYGGAFGVTKGLIEKFGSDRVIDTPISEAGFIGAAVGAALAGLRPVVELMFVDFFGVAMDQIYNQMAKLRYMSGGQLKVPLTLRAPIGAGISAAAQHSQTLYSIFAHVPGLKVVVPSTPHDAKGLLISSIRDDNPVVFLEHKVLYGIKGEVPEEEYTIPLGKAEIRREGDDVTVIGIARTVWHSLEAAEQLSKESISVEVIDVRSIVPFDKETVIKSVKKTGRVVIVDEDYDRCGFASWVSSIIADEAFEYLDAPIKRITTPNVPIPFSPPLEQYILPDSKKIVNTVKSILG
ncbi:alpha-ketoacid dehydrogenase subunit beta [Saccharolobus solfataricus]|uniref:2-oxoacid oxidoreductase (ferredoxin) n=3 Tax=Saccharolobus solfataricus TaxID=2287 RepID=Q97Y22_SACS2|nr:alpha-ketoacid dehydrogenase subunit beta [Saccharolobus solfataricus]AAK41749.1 Pyruvate dehydrogenase, beta subunit (lipoamide). (pdhB-2) [Saccharolobus solfataricus P2]AKA74543.1 alpha-ketoacid dehydrogenase subunit beta [Saccharolobus solfataricus]AKA77239.1 alpha-ketoacid dehydrogenase subunit beta [Saccharolobus solfataricus]AKA79931.1 alpha-ketoacid dehydrogenase subunit beta [Saccharolobus solfataricus]AZF69017.1 alpha-ketoacid dehydrogenase subunit beta [Saccharolobus solfataricus]